jgi:hypothetical protein
MHAWVKPRNTSKFKFGPTFRGIGIIPQRPERQPGFKLWVWCVVGQLCRPTTYQNRFFPPGLPLVIGEISNHGGAAEFRTWFSQNERPCENHVYTWFA